MDPWGDFVTLITMGVVEISEYSLSNLAGEAENSTPLSKPGHLA
jgi:hypothetical protein